MSILNFIYTYIVFLNIFVLKKNIIVILLSIIYDNIKKNNFKVKIILTFLYNAHMNICFDLSR